MASCCGANKEAIAAIAQKGGFKAQFISILDKLGACLASWPAIALAGAALVASFIGWDGTCAHHSHGTLRWTDPAWIALVLCGIPIAKEAILSLVFERKIRAALLITMAMVSCVAIAQLFAAGEVAFIMALGEKLERFTVSRARRGLEHLASLIPATARKVNTCPHCIARGELFKEIPPSDLVPGDLVRVLPGETIPADGIVTEGTSTVDQSIMTGESLPVEKSPGSEVYSGTINRFGAMTLRVLRPAADSSLEKMVRLVKEAAKKKAPIVRIADKWAGILVPVSLGVALATFFGAWAWHGSAAQALTPAVTIMVVFCPCSLALAAPVCIMAAIGQAAKAGVIVKSGEAIEKMAAVGIAAMDKTGTLTTGRLSVADVSAPEILPLAAAVEASSEHPLAKAICAAAGAVHPAADFRMVPGKGASGMVDGAKIVCGTKAWLTENGAAVPRAAVESLPSDGKAVVLVAKDGVYQGFITLSDTRRENAADAIRAMREAGLDTALLTGDRPGAARSVAADLGIENVMAELLPQDKAAAIERLRQSAGKAVAMIGDGVNDALALKTADIGIAICGEGSDIAVESADIAIRGEDLAKVAYLKRLGMAAVKLVKFNIAISMTINAIAICLSILGCLTPVTGALVHNATSFFVVLNAALLYDRKIA